MKARSSGGEIVLEPYSYLQPKQREFLDCGAKYKLMGGSNGGGKSFAFRAEAFRSSNIIPRLKGLVLRRSRPEVEKNFCQPMLDETRMKMPDGTEKPYANWIPSKNVIWFPNQSRIDIGYCEDKRDVRRYQGLEYDWIGIEELTQWEEEDFRRITTSMRTTKKGVRPFFMGSCNPGDIGHAWVKRLFINRQFMQGEIAEDYAMVRANIWDNKVLMEADPEYLRNLESLPEKLRRARLYGDWDIFEGQYFEEFRRDLHVTKPFIPMVGVRKRIVAVDYGFTKPSCALWMALMNDGRIIVYRELYETKLLFDALALRISALSTEKEQIRLVIADPSVVEKKNEKGNTFSHEFKARDLVAVAANNKRLEGWNLTRSLLHPRTDENSGNPYSGILITENCPNLIRTLPEQIHDERDVEDLNTKAEDHAVDALRYGIMELGDNISSVDSIAELNEALSRHQTQPLGSLGSPKTQDAIDDMTGHADTPNILYEEF